MTLRHLLAPTLAATLIILWQLLWLWGLPEFVLSPVEVARHFVAALGSSPSVPSSGSAWGSWRGWPGGSTSW